MNEHATSTANEIIQAVNTKIGVTATNTAVASGLVVTAGKPELVTEAGRAGAYLATNYIGVLSYLECIQVTGAVWIVYQILSLAYKQISSLYRSIKNGQ